MKRTQIQLDEETHHNLREEAYARKTSMTELIREALRKYLQPDILPPTWLASRLWAPGASSRVNWPRS